MSEDSKWLTENPPKSLYFLPPVANQEDLPRNQDAWTAVWVDEMDDLFVFAFGQWMPFAEAVEKETKILGIGVS